MRSPSVQKGTNSGKEVDILRSIQMRGIGLSGPCKTPDFVPASIYLRGQKSDQDIGLEDTTMTDSLLDFSTAPASAPSSPIRIPNGGTHLVDFEVKLRRGRKGLGLRLVGGAEEGTQVHVGAITPGGPAELSGQIFPGDQLVAINGVSVLGATHTGVVHLLNVTSRSPSGNFPSNTTITLSFRGYRSNPTSFGNGSSMEHIDSIQAYSPLRQYSFRRSCSEDSSINLSSSILSSGQNSPFHRSLGTTPKPGTASTIYKVQLQRRANESFGFAINCSLSPKRGWHIGAITPGGPADRSKQLHVGDKITEMNGYPLALQSHADVVEQLCTKHHRLELIVERQQARKVFQIPVLDANDNTMLARWSESRSNERRKQQQPSFLEPVPEALDSSWNSRTPSPLSCNLKESGCYAVDLTADERGFGFSLRMSQGLHRGTMTILHIEKGGPAFRDGKMQVGDEVLEINGTPTESLTYTQAAKVVKYGGEHIHLKLQRVNTRIYDLSV
ncbi:Membrane-associated guanylate kinase, WW and PDZ domain-containing protein 3 [Echinococcus granulosus]|uniref:Membrane associated guanylate kinase ww and pdz n=1 Tax=Echinococcus granulosus TaxID=6210 RepID=A0A068WW19_ECHGR|nr:Membrane-associated guanylate kinase, WW and PDZ domain-containing protein 3 [Echinococcus granulosus]CDS21820.1 membrane associated guanylate kinase ww and pdz [Echinococcus granulosus]